MQKFPDKDCEAELSRIEMIKAYGKHPTRHPRRRPEQNLQTL